MDIWGRVVINNSSVRVFFSVNFVIVSTLRSILAGLRIVQICPLCYTRIVQGVLGELKKSISFVLNPVGIPGANMGGKQIFKHIHFDNRLQQFQKIEFCRLYSIVSILSKY